MSDLSSTYKGNLETSSAHLLEENLSCKESSELPLAAADQNILTTREACDLIEPVRDKKIHELAVFDFDGTCINGNSPVLLVRRLIRKRQLKLSVILRIFIWATAYKLRLPQNEFWIRGLVFRAFKGKEKAQVDDFLESFYNEVISNRFRPGINEIMKRHKELGRRVLVVSASFDPLIAKAQARNEIDVQISTHMQIDANGCYLDKVQGIPVEGKEKVRAIKRYANKEFGEGAWCVAYAYGDHHSDIPMLNLARNPYPVTPDRPLMRHAKRKHWPVIEISHKEASEVQPIEEIDISPIPQIPIIR